MKEIIVRRNCENMGCGHRDCYGCWSGVEDICSYFIGEEKKKIVDDNYKPCIDINRPKEFKGRHVNCCGDCK